MGVMRPCFPCFPCLPFLFLSSCSSPPPSSDPAAPFYGPAERSATPAPFAAPIPTPAPPPVTAPPVPDEAARRRGIWTSGGFRCRAISTTRLRPCHFEPTATGWSITFPIADLTCDEVVFDAAGDPAELRSCRSAWLSVPQTVALRRDRTGAVWSGSHAGWRWPGDGESYCCPGVWIEAPGALRGR
jgi:hypothetical protein